MKTLILTSLFILGSCASVEKVGDNIFMAECDSFFGDCETEMKETCPGGYKQTAKHSKWYKDSSRTFIHFTCNDAVSQN